MKKKSAFLISLLVGMCLFPPKGMASAISEITGEKANLNPAFELAKIENAYKVAGVCFLGVGDCGDASYGSIDGDGGYTMDTAQQCKNEGFTSSCSDGWRPLIGGNCPYNPNYVTCCQSSCPTNSSPDCTGAEVADDGCGYRCKQCCSDVCPSGSKDYTGSYASTTECGSTCYKCNTSCPSGSKTSYTGTSVGTNECGQSCKKCNTSCPSGYTSSPTSECYDTTTNECGDTCYKAKDCDPCPGYYDCGGTWQYCEGSTCYADSSRCSTYCESDHFPYSCGSDYGPCYGDYRNGYCSVPCDKIETDPCADVSGLSCSNGCASYGSCGQCTSCNPTPPSDPCAGVTCPTAVSCGSAGCANYSSSTSCCSSVCTSCNQEPEEPDDPCDGVTGLTCEYGCASYGSCGQCISCNSCTYSSQCPGYSFVSCSYGIEDSCTACGTTKYKCKTASDTCPAGYSKSDGCGCSYGFKATRTEAGSVCTKCCTSAENPTGYHCMKCATQF